MACCKENLGTFSDIDHMDSESNVVLFDRLTSY
ncbi:hypothetical protein FOCG_06436 [Fusarium oxysporum f. sp. radicis-lycopersici 26381]|nr:hypothetical protein FOCG_06436 [Fusarium oxysporum f. sp. radicis-lycopersici 26381]